MCFIAFVLSLYSPMIKNACGDEGRLCFRSSLAFSTVPVNNPWLLLLSMGGQQLVRKAQRHTNVKIVTLLLLLHREMNWILDAHGWTISSQAT
jgi:hypothetical protein